MTKATRTLHHQRWQNVVEVATGWCESNILPCLSIVTGTAETISAQFHAGRQVADNPTPLSEDAIFLIASITKPIIAMAALRLIENGHLTLADRVVDFIPGFGREGKYGIEVRHLLTHTSGLPDMLNDNLELRQSHATLARFHLDAASNTKVWGLPFLEKSLR